jgi:hypothetical protein
MAHPFTTMVVDLVVLEHVWVETSGHYRNIRLWWALQRLLDAAGTHRLVIGTDWPFTLHEADTSMPEAVAWVRNVVGDAVFRRDAARQPNAAAPLALNGDCPCSLVRCGGGFGNRAVSGEHETVLQSPYPVVDGLLWVERLEGDGHRSEEGEEGQASAQLCVRRKGGKSLHQFGDAAADGEGTDPA